MKQLLQFFLSDTVQGSAAASNYGSMSVNTVRPLLFAGHPGAGDTACLWLERICRSIVRPLLLAHPAFGLSMLAVQHYAWHLAPSSAACHSQRT